MTKYNWYTYIYTKAFAFRKSFGLHLDSLKVKMSNE